MIEQPSRLSISGPGEENFEGQLQEEDVVHHQHQEKSTQHIRGAEPHVSLSNRVEHFWPPETLDDFQNSF